MRIAIVTAHLSIISIVQYYPKKPFCERPSRRVQKRFLNMSLSERSRFQMIFINKLMMTGIELKIRIDVMLEKTSPQSAKSNYRSFLYMTKFLPDIG